MEAKVTPTEGLRDAEVQTARVADTVATETSKVAEKAEASPTKCCRGSRDCSS